MLIIAIETSARPPSVAIRTAGVTRQITLDQDCRNASDLLPELHSLLIELDIAPSRIQQVIVGTGPGSYTGLRVGIATALGISRGCSADLQAVPSFEAIAIKNLECGESGAVLLDARSKQFYRACYLRTDSGLECLHSPSVISAHEWRADLPQTDCLLVSDATVLNADFTTQERQRVRECSVPQAAEILELGIARFKSQGPLQPEQVEPLYLRPFAANIRRR